MENTKECCCAYITMIIILLDLLEEHSRFKNLNFRKELKQNLCRIFTMKGYCLKKATGKHDKDFG